MVLFGIFFSLIAVQNTLPVPVQLFNYRVINIPLYLVALISLLAGIFISWGISLINSLATAFLIRNKNINLRQSTQEIKKLQQRINELESENAILQNNSAESKKDFNESIFNDRKIYPKPGFFDRLRHAASV